MEFRCRRYFRIQHIPRATHIGKLPLRTSSIFLLEHVNILLPLCGTSKRPCHAVRGPLSHARMLEGRTHQAVSVGYRRRHESLDKLLLKYTRALTDKDGSWYKA